MDITSLAAIKAIDGLVLRQAATANNIANANTEGFAASRVDFEAALRGALATADANNVRRSPVTEFTEKLTAVGQGGGRVRIDQEVAQMSETTMNYLLLVNMLDRKSSMTKLVLNDGRGQ